LCCEYCQLPQEASSIPFEIDHIVAQKHHGQTVADNLAWSCFYCNSAKGPNIAGLTTDGELVALFHPRRDRWSEHFRWEGALLIGLSAVGRATITVLNINSEDQRLLRESLIREGSFPPMVVGGKK
jgi:HNH endonuclease